MNRTEASLNADVEEIGRISFLPALLEVICRTAGMGFAAVARVTPDRWIAGAVRDEIQFGLVPGGELPVETTICHEIMQSGKPVVIDHVAFDANYCIHNTPLTYGFQSYISIPIIRQDGSFFGTLCAIDSSPALLNSHRIINMFKVFASLISFRLDAASKLPDEEIARMETQIATELNATLQAISGVHESASSVRLAEKIEQLSMKISQLVQNLRTAAV